MATTHLTSSPGKPVPEHTLRVCGPAELLNALPYVMGFHPQNSLVLVGLHDARLVVTARLDLDDVTGIRGYLDDTLLAMHNGGATLFVAIVYDDSNPPAEEFVEQLVLTACLTDCAIADVLYVAQQRWWSLGCEDDSCCDAAGHPLEPANARLRAEAAYAGLSAFPDRQALAATLEPLSARQRLLPALGKADVVTDASGLCRELDEAARRLTAPVGGSARVQPLTRRQLVRFGAALRNTEIRDAVWVAVDADSLGTEQLWRELARRLPPPYDAAPLFLLAWAAFRAGNGALANIACSRALASDPAYGAAKLLATAVSRGVDPRRLPGLGTRAADEAEGQWLQSDRA